MSEKLKEFIDTAVEVVNKKVNLAEFKEKYSPGEDRTLLFIVRGSDAQYGFMVETGKVKATSKIEDPTVLISTDEDTFWKLALKKITMNYAVATNKLRIVGEYFLRDFVILRNFFEEVQGVLKL